MAKATVVKTARIAILITILAFVPGLACSLAGLSAAAGLSALGAILGGIGMAIGGLRVGIHVVIGMTVATTLSVLSAHTPWAAFLLFLALGLLVGIVGRTGAWTAYMYVPLAAGFVLGEDPQVFAQPVIDAIALGLALGASALFAVGITAWAMRHSPTHALTPITASRGRIYGVLLGLLMGSAAAAVTAFDLGHTGSWIILTIIVIVQPYLQDGWSKALQRAGGTVLGFVIAIAVGFLVPWPVAVYVIASIAGVLTIYTMLTKRPYWQYAIPLTVAIVLFESAGTSIAKTAEHRLLATLAGVGASLLAMAILIPFSRREAQRQGLTHY